ncbi:MAG TPA: hypothetical protein VFU22_12265, partial [Roseiflexaceae bacterium]|nr:hypothetical protein [Roseiflexaceae bacterium]
LPRLPLSQIGRGGWGVRDVSRSIDQQFAISGAQLACDEAHGRLPRASTLESWRNHPRFTGRLDDLFGHRLEFVNLEEVLDFGAEAMQQAEVASGDADDRCSAIC